MGTKPSRPGYIAISRAIFDHPLFKARPDWHVAWEKLIAAAAWKPQAHAGRWGTAHVERGQFAMTVRGVSELLGWPTSSVIYFFGKLEMAKMISRQPIRTKINTQDGGRNSQRITVVTICNYDKFQPIGRAKSIGFVQGIEQGVVQETLELPGIISESASQQTKQYKESESRAGPKKRREYKPAHGSRSEDKIWVWWDHLTTEWTAYAKDFRDTRGADKLPESRIGGKGNWFRWLGETPKRSMTSTQG